MILASVKNKNAKERVSKVINQTYFIGFLSVFFPLCK